MPMMMLAEPNVYGGWRGSSAWASWEAPVAVARGEGFYLEALERYAGPPRPYGYLVPLEVTLRREPENPHDPHAVRLDSEAATLAYLDRELAVHVAALMDAAGVPEFTVAGLIRGGSHTAYKLRLLLWPWRRLSAGPDLSHLRELPAVPWPASPDEGRPAEPMHG